MCKYYDKRSRKARELRLTEEMAELVPDISRVCIKGKKAFLYNGQAKPFEAPYADDPIETCKALKQILINELRCAEPIASRWVNHLADLLVESPLEGEDDEEEKRTYLIHKYNKGIPLIESVIVSGQPYFIRMKEGLDFELLPRYETNSRVLKPIDMDSDMSEPYVFESEEDIRHYLKLARKLSDP
jgi:hypothetical protein